MVRTTPTQLSKSVPAVRQSLLFIPQRQNDLWLVIFSNGFPTPYKLAKNNEDGSELIFAMMPTLLEDSEFEENYKVIEDICNTQPDTETTIKEIESNENSINALLVLCDNVYRRVNNDNLCIISNKSFYKNSNKALDKRFNVSYTFGKLDFNLKNRRIIVCLLLFLQSVYLCF